MLVGLVTDLPDRRLTMKELSAIGLKDRNQRFDALKTHSKEGTRPSLHDVCLFELKGMVDGLTQIVVEQGKKIKALEKKK